MPPIEMEKLSPLQAAAANGRAGELAALLAGGADVNEAKANGVTPVSDDDDEDDEGGGGEAELTEETETAILATYSY